jgi:uncharacterized membrane protein YcaP (DUF421 family)
MEENPTFIINNGILDIKVMEKLRYNIDDLMEQVRINGVDSISDIKFAVLESNGQLSIIQKGQESSLIPFPLIKDGEIDKRTLEIIKKDKDWLINKLKSKGYKDEKGIFLCVIEKNENLFLVEK